ncbi:MAG: LysE family translocator [Pseudomonadota bacterium]
MSELALYLPGFIAAYSILVVGASSPGPAVAMLLGIASSQGRSAALVTCLGIALGSATLNVLTLMGVGLLISQAAWAMTLLRILGAGYLAYLAYGAFRKASAPPVVQELVMESLNAGRAFAKGYALQITNPKAIAFWLAISALAATDGGGWTVVAAFILGAAVISFICHAAWALVLSSQAVRRAYQNARRWIEGALGAFFAFAAFKLATTRI